MRKRERDKFLWGLFWENKTYKVKRSIFLFSDAGKRPACIITYDSGGMASRSLASDNNMRIRCYNMQNRSVKDHVARLTISSLDTKISNLGYHYQMSACKFPVHFNWTPIFYQGKVMCEDCCHPFSWLLHDKKELFPKKYKTERFDCTNGLVAPCNLLSKKFAFCRLTYIPTFRKFVSCFKEPYTPVNLWKKVFAQF